MWFRNLFILFSVFIFISESAFAQHKSAKADTTIYKTIESYSKRSKFTKFMYGQFFKSYTVRPKKKQIQKPYSSFEGKIIRNINIKTLDPFGNSIADTVVPQKSFFTRVGNNLHLKSQNLTIRNLLLIHPKQKFDSLLVNESERLIREKGFVRDVDFFVKATSANSDSVDIFIRELDTWSIIPEVSVIASSYTIKLNEDNFLGSGNVFQNSFNRNLSKGINKYSTGYSIPNFRNTFISTTLHYDIDEDNNFSKSLIIDRPFYSTFTKWAGGLFFKELHSVYVPLNFKLFTQDYWAGHAQRILKGNSVEERTTNLITTARYQRIRYQEKPTLLDDPLSHYSDEDFFLAAIGISTRKYIQDKYLFKYGITEDVPVGLAYVLTGGYQVKNNVGRIFLGTRFSLGNYYPWGYLSSNLKFETFFHGSRTEEGIFTADVKYFTQLFEIGKWKFRQFAKSQIDIGIHRFAYDSLTLNDGFGIDGFRSTTLSGTNRFLFSLQTQSYAPLNFIGFRFGPFLTYSLGMLGNAETGFKSSKLYSQIGLGVLIKNENLILNTFQLSISFYPIIPGIGQNVFKTNAFQTTDFGFSNFEIGKPSAMVFQ
jgi:hypothetical protein